MLTSKYSTHFLHKITPAFISLMLIALVFSWGHHNIQAQAGDQSDNLIYVAPPCRLQNKLPLLANENRDHGSSIQSANTNRSVDLGANGSIGNYRGIEQEYQSCADDTAIASISGHASTSYDSTGGGHSLYITNPQTGISVEYLHFKVDADNPYRVEDSQWVNIGDELATIGRSGGISNFDHIHFSVFDGGTSQNNKLQYHQWQFANSTQYLTKGGIVYAFQNDSPLPHIDIRTSAGSEEVKGHVEWGNIGQITDGPIEAAGRIWWNVDWGNPEISVADGWIVQEHLGKVNIPFADVLETTTFAYDITRLYEAGIISGFKQEMAVEQWSINSAGKAVQNSNKVIQPLVYGPELPVNRDVITKFVANAIHGTGKLGHDSVKDCAEAYDGEGFPDIGDSKFQVYILCLAELEVISGFSDGKYYPDEPVLRQEMAKFIVGAMLVADVLSFEDQQACAEYYRSQEGFSDFPDIESDNKFRDYITCLKGEGIITGDRDGKYHPENTITRGQLAKFIAHGDKSLLAHFVTYPVYEAGLFVPLGEVDENTEAQSPDVAEVATDGGDARAIASTYETIQGHWIASEDGLSYYSETGYRPAAYFTSGLTNTHATHVAQPAPDQVWVGTLTGLHHYDGSAWQQYTTADGLPDDQINYIASPDPNIAWVATSGGVGYYNGLTWQSHTTSQGLPSNDVIAIAADATSNAWVATADGSLTAWDGASWNGLTNPPSQITSLDYVSDTLVIGADSGLWTYDGVAFNQESGAFMAKSISHDHEDRLWIVTKDGRLILYSLTEGLLTDDPEPYTDSLDSPDSGQLFTHLNAPKRLHWTMYSDAIPANTFVAPSSDWVGDNAVYNGIYDSLQSYSLDSPHACIFQTSVTDENGEEIGGQDAGEFINIFTQIWGVHRTTLREADITANSLNNCDLLILPSFTLGYEQDVIDALGPDALSAMADYANDGGHIYAQGEGMYLTEEAGLVPDGTVTANDLQPSRGDGLGTVTFDDPTYPLNLGWESDALLILDDPIINVTGDLQTIASYDDTIGGPHPAVVTNSVGYGEVTLVSGRANSRLYSDQWILLRNALLMATAEKSEYFGHAMQTFTDTVAANIIPAFEGNIPISATLNYNHLWQGTTLNSVTITEVVESGFVVDVASINPIPTSISTQISNGMTETVIVWSLGDVTHGDYLFTYQAHTEEDAVQGWTLFSDGEVTYTDDGRPVTLERDAFTFRAALPADIRGGHDNELDRHYTIPDDGLYIEEWIWAENIEDSSALNTTLVRYVPIIAPIVGLEEQREVLATNAGETVWMRNDIFVFEDDVTAGRDLPIGLDTYTETWGIDQWDGTTFVTMTTSGGYHIDPILDSRSPTPGYFITIPPTYTNAITVTANGELLLPAIRLEWDIGEYPAFQYDVPLARYGIHTYEIFSRPVSFTGDPFVDTVVVDATGGSIYTGAGTDPLMYRDYLDVEIEVHQPEAPADQGFTYEDIWGRVHTETLRANFVDVFNFAACGCGPGASLGERSAALNVTFEILVDTDGDGIEETSLVDFVDERGVMPTRLDGHIIYYIKSRNLGSTIALGENVIDEGVFRGINYSIVPSNTTWADSYESTHSTLLTDTIDGAYHHLIFQQEIPPAQTDLIEIHGKIEMNGSVIEGLMQLHQGARFVYRQNHAGDAQYEVHDTHVQATFGKRSDATLDAFAMPSLISTYTDTVFLDLAISDPHDFRTFDRDPYLNSWGHGLSAATVYVGGREKRTVYHSLISLGDDTLLRVELNNNEVNTWTGVGVTPVAPAGITVTEMYTDNVPVSLWHDLPFLHLETIPEAGYAVYYFRVETDENGTDLQGVVHEIEIQVSGNGLPADFAVPPAVLAIRYADGSAPRVAYGTSENIRLTDELPEYVTLLDVKLLNDSEFATLQGLVVDDTAVIPATNLSDDFFNALTRTLPFTMDGQTIMVTVPDETVPWLDREEESDLHVVIYSDIAVDRAANYPIHSQSVLSSTDSFGMDWADTDIANETTAIGAALETTYEVMEIIHGNTRIITNYLAINQWNTVTISMTIHNDGTDIANNVTSDVAFTNPFSITSGSADVTADGQTLLWNVAANLAPGASRVATVTLDVFATSPILTVRAVNDTIIDAMLAIEQTDSTFFNVTSGVDLTAQTGGELILPVGYRSPTAPAIHQFASDAVTLVEGDVTAEQIVSLVRGGNTAQATTITVNMNGITAIDGIDFVAETIVVNFAADQSTAEIPIEIIGNLDIEPNRTIALSLSGFTDSAVAGTTTEMLVTIQDDDDVSAVSTSHTFPSNEAVIAEGDTALSTEFVTLYRTGFLDQSSTVSVTISAGTAVPGVDFVAETVQVTFAPGEETAEVPIQVIGDHDTEEDKTVILSMSGFTKIWLAGDQIEQTVRIRDDDNYVYLPTIMNNYVPPLPDLIVSSLIVTTNTVTVVIDNQGEAIVSDDFWVDVYIDPDTAPTAVDDRWDVVGTEGIAWGVTEDIAAGGSLTLTLSSPYYDGTRSSFSGNVNVGTAVYAQVDAVSHAETSYGAVRETHERDQSTYNNILQSMSVE